MSGYSGTSVGRDFLYMDYSVNSAGNITAVNWRKVDMDTKKLYYSSPAICPRSVHGHDLRPDHVDNIRHIGSQRHTRKHRP